MLETSACAAAAVQTLKTGLQARTLAWSESSQQTDNNYFSEGINTQTYQICTLSKAFTSHFEV